ncbi:MAG: hypothetical protein KAS66_14965, partial [Candidatus Omnitrophica bacterium]|nr:hypothetical protein [Candidatus Omnitrophota bacterium]
MFEGIQQFFRRSRQFIGEIVVGKKQRYDVPGILAPSMKFDDNKRSNEKAEELGIIVIPYEGSGNIIEDIEDNKSNVITICGFTSDPQKVIPPIPDEVYARNNTADCPGLDINVKRSIKDISLEYCRRKNKGIDSVRPAALLRTRHMHEQGKGLFSQLRDAGIVAGDEDYETLKKKVEAEGIYPRGNMSWLLRNDLGPFVGILNKKGERKVDLILGDSRPAEALIKGLIAGMLGWAFSLSLAGRGVSEERGVDSSMETHNGIFDEWEKGALIKSGLIKSIGRTWQAIRPKKAGLAFAFLKESFWDEDIKKISVRDKGEQVSIDVIWIGSFGEAELIRISYKTVIPKLKKKIARTKRNAKKAESYAKLADSYANLRLFKEAKESIEKAIALSQGRDVQKEYQSISHYIEARRIRVEEQDIDRLEEDMIENLTLAMNLWEGNVEARSLLRRLYVFLGDGRDGHWRRAIEMEETQLSEGRDMKEKIRGEYYYARGVFTRAREIFSLEFKEKKARREFFEEFPSSRFKRLRRQRIELEKDLVDAKIAVCNIKLGQAGIVTKQTIYSELGRHYEKIAGLSNELGYTQEALRYFDLAQANYELLTKECEGIFPAETQKKKARLYMNECVYPLAQKHYAKLLDPQKALRLAVYYKHTEQTNLEDFFLGIFFDSFKEVLPEYVGCRLLLKDEGQELIEETRRKTIQWLETCKDTVKEWIMNARLTSDDEGVVTVEVIENGRKRRKELLDIITEAENKKDKNKGRTHAIKKESNDKASSPANSPEPKLIGELTSNEVRGGAFFSPIEPILYSSYIVRTSSSPVLANSEASRIMEEAFKNGLSIWRKFKLAQYRYVGLDNIAINLKYFKDEA